MDIGPLFIASYDNGVGCAGCEEELLEGNLIAYVDGELQCEPCVRYLRHKETTKFTKNWSKRK